MNRVHGLQALNAVFSKVNPMVSLRELHIKSLKVRSLTMANFLLDSFPSLEKTSSWMLNMNQEDTRAFRARVKEYRERGIKRFGREFYDKMHAHGSPVKNAERSSGKYPTFWEFVTAILETGQ